MGSLRDATVDAQYRIGVDVGGTNTDAVLISLSPTQIIAAHKAPTTPDVTSGIIEALNAVISAGHVPLEAISCVIIGTTHFVNAVVQRSPSLAQVGVVRLCGGSKDGFGLGLPPFVDYPDDLRRLIHGRSISCNGGHQITGIEISALDESELSNVAEQLVDQQIADVVVTGIYSPLNSSHELRAEKILMDKMNQLAVAKNLDMQPKVTLSHRISSTGFLARENAAILNAALRPLAEKTILGFEQAMDHIFQHVPCALYLTQNDGSVLKANEAINLPIRTFNSGPTNSIRGGKFLWDVASAKAGLSPERREDGLVVIDVGGTTSDSGLLLPNGLPQMRSVLSSIGGVRTNFALPAVESIGLGGGSVVIPQNDGTVSVGPDSVALELRKKAKLFGGDVLTTTDIVAADELYTPAEKGHLSSMGGDCSLLRDITPETVQEARKAIRRSLEELIDRTKVSKSDVDVLIVGGGAILVDIDESLPGVRTIRRVKGGEVANAVGAAISRASATVDGVINTSQKTIKQAQAEACDMAMKAAIENGAQLNSLEIVAITILPVQYVDSQVRIVVRAAGELNPVLPQRNGEMLHKRKLEPASSSKSKNSSLQASVPTPQHNTGVNLQTYRPRIEHDQWLVSITDLEWICEGCKVLGCGGGGDPYETFIRAKQVLERAPGSIKIISASSLPPAGTVGCTGDLGSPEVSSERMAANECNKAHDELMRVMGYKPVEAFIALEIGGGNGVTNLEVAASCNVPCVDGDYMGRAYPTAWQTTPNVYGTSKGEALVPAVIASGDGSFLIMTQSRTDRLVDKILRTATVEMGCRAGHAGPPKSSQVVQEQSIPNTVSLAWRIGKAIALEKTVADRANRIIEAVGGNESAKTLASGKIVSVERVLRAGHSYGVVEIDGSIFGNGITTKARISIPFKNENAYVEAKTVATNGDMSTPTILASVPDLIAVLDSETGQGLGTPDYKYGLKVIVVAIAASPRWTDTARGLELGGPRSMGFDDVKYVPIGRYSTPRSVIEEYSSLP
ncbi:hypothetical protein H2200_008468 [Cladophialophora chaetospira]|uniref:Hydantoinase n=1 Tax=Cladophialophora chaetospira TaxID=386627 RepID=A0AA38X5U5_9EURO|nr:hypothetical protein H2200_008468 [Cladophialophora chaetospira]